MFFLNDVSAIGECHMKPFVPSTTVDSLRLKQRINSSRLGLLHRPISFHSILAIVEVFALYFKF